MHLSKLTARNFRQFGDHADILDVSFTEGITVLVGRNDSGKTALIDALRYALLTRDQNPPRVQPDDFHIDAAGQQATEIRIRCQFTKLDTSEKGAFAEHLTYDDTGTASLFVNWNATRLGAAHAQRRWVDVSVRSGRTNNGPPFEYSIRELLSSTYLRPLRDAAREMSPGRNSRLSQVLANVPEVLEGLPFDAQDPPKQPTDVANLSLLGLADYLRHNVQNHKGIRSAEESLNTQYLSSLLLSGDNLQGTIGLTEGGTDNVRLRQILERLELSLLGHGTEFPRGQYGLGSNNLLYMACELLLLGREPEGLPLLLIEEPEAHLHPQRQLRLMHFLKKAANGSLTDSPRSVQVLLSTHSPTLASNADLSCVTILERGQAFSLHPKETRLSPSDYLFLERFLDATKANLFFAHGVLIVEGVAEATLLPTVARLIHRDLTENGISIVNVGGTGLRRYSRIFQRSDNRHLPIPVACVTDFDVLPDCAPQILGLVGDDNDPKWTSPKRRWRAERDFNDTSLQAKRAAFTAEDSAAVKTFVSHRWTFEYELALCGLAKEVHIAIQLAANDDKLHSQKASISTITTEATEAFERLEKTANGDRQTLCAHIYEPLHAGASKAITAQHLARILAADATNEAFSAADFESRLPTYLVNAIKHVCTPLPTKTGDSGHDTKPNAP